MTDDSTTEEIALELISDHHPTVGLVYGERFAVAIETRTLRIASTRLQSLDAENARLKADLDAFRRHYEPYTCLRCGKSTRNPNCECLPCAVL